MEKHLCKLCNRSFINGRALGGHMRSHARPATVTKALPAGDYSSSSTSSGEAKGLSYGLRENPRKSFRMVDPEFSSLVLVQDRESESESYHKEVSFKRRRSKRPRRRELPEAAELLRLYSNNTSPEVDLAITFMLLSRDVWNKYEEDEEEYEAEEEGKIAVKEQFCSSSSSPAKGRSRFQCGTCKKVFRSYQALGGHRASHKKSRSCFPPGNESGNKMTMLPEEANADGKSSVHVCPICLREFACGQALGGHKRSHQLSSSTNNINISSPAPNPKQLRECFFDLNLPAPLEEEDDYDYAELSAISEAEFLNSGTPLNN